MRERERVIGACEIEELRVRGEMEDAGRKAHLTS